MKSPQAVPQSAAQYIARTAGGITIYPVATETVYRNANGSVAQTTSYSYTWFTGKVAVESVTVTWPVVGSGQNGPGTADTETTYFDTYGLPIWHKDGDGFLRYTAYDYGTGAVLKAITDVDTTQTSTFANKPSGWTTPSGGGLHLTTTAEVDDLGRTTKLTEPRGTVHYAVYKDTNHEVRIYPGWNSTINLPTGPTQVLRADRQSTNSYVETLTMSAVPTVSNGRPTGAEAISRPSSATAPPAAPPGRRASRAAPCAWAPTTPYPGAAR